MNLDLNKFRAKPNESIREHTDKLIVQANLLNDLGYIKSVILFSDLLVGSEYHDYGKANTAFLKRLNTHKHFNSNKEVPHSVLSVFFVDKDKCSDYISVCYAVLYHHYHKKSPMAYLRENEELIMNFLEEMGGNHIPFEEIYDCIDEIGDIFLLPFDNSKKQYAVLLKGFLHKCDYSASAGIDCEKENDFLIDVIENWKTVNRFRFNPL
ncbi:MAG: CRISPR-associated endonuclease Cas3'' [Clostridiales bacterium]|nr:CRISPR-associated endonuclease Cas3'' [Clostridiales bacterium]